MHKHKNWRMYNNFYDQCQCGALLFPDTTNEAYSAAFVEEQELNNTVPRLWSIL